MSKSLQLMLAEIWNHLDHAAIPAPSHRNRTMTDWAARIERVKAMLADAQNAAMEADIQLRKLATAHKLNETASAHHQALSNEIGRLQGEIRLLRDTLGMERYRVAWRPVSDGFTETDDDILIVQDDPAFIAPIITIARWNDVDERLVTHWAPLPGLPPVDL